MGIQDRDYMRRADGHDAYHDQLFAPSRAIPMRSSRRRSAGWLLAIVLVGLIGTVVLPHFAIDGHHWRVWML